MIRKQGIFNMITTMITVLRQLAERREGAIAIIFGLCAIPAVIAAGMAIDVGRAYMVKITGSRARRSGAGGRIGDQPDPESADDHPAKLFHC